MCLARDLGKKLDHQEPRDKNVTSLVGFVNNGTTRDDILRALVQTHPGVHFHLVAGKWRKQLWAFTPRIEYLP